MTGNTVLLALHAVRGEMAPALRCAFALASFAAARSLAAILVPDHVPEAHSHSDLAVAARIEFPLVAAFSALWMLQRTWGVGVLGVLTIVLAAVALGIQSVAVRRLQIAGVVTTFITGTITASVVELTGALRHREGSQRPEEISHIGVLGSMFLLYLAAAFAGGYLAIHHSSIAALLPLPTLVPILFHRK